jgi:hypothetical protein
MTIVNFLSCLFEKSSEEVIVLHSTRLSDIGYAVLLAACDCCKKQVRRCLHVKEAYYKECKSLPVNTARSRPKISYSMLGRQGDI